MCELCSQDKAEREAGRDAAIRFAAELKELSTWFYVLADGTIKPHTDDVDKIGLRARSVIRKLVNDWM